MPSVVIITGAAGLIGSEAAQFYCEQGHLVAGIDNDMRSRFFGPEASTRWKRDALLRDYALYTHHDIDIRDREAVDRVFQEYGADVGLIIHAAAQPSHDWAVRDPQADFTINANGTLTILEATRRFCPDAAFVFTSTNKVYGDRPNELPLVETDTRWEIDGTHPFWSGIDESMSIDATKHSLFGASKAAADLLVQEYGRYFGLKTACLRAGCLTGPNQSGVQLHGFLSYLLRCIVDDVPYTVFGYLGKQVRDNLHSRDYVSAIDQFYRAPRVGRVYNIGGGRSCSCSVLEAIELCEDVAGRRLRWQYSDKPRIGDHIWWITNSARFQDDYPGWHQQYDLRTSVEQMLEQHAGRYV